MQAPSGPPDAQASLARYKHPSQKRLPGLHTGSAGLMQLHSSVAAWWLLAAATHGLTAPARRPSTRAAGCAAAQEAQARLAGCVHLLTLPAQSAGCCDRLRLGCRPSAGAAGLSWARQPAAGARGAAAGLAGPPEPGPDLQSSTRSGAGPAGRGAGPADPGTSRLGLPSPVHMR